MMLISMGSRVRRWQRRLRLRLADPRIHGALEGGTYLLCGGLLAAASLGGRPVPLAPALVCAASGWPGVLLAAGGLGGYLLFWGAAGAQGALWVALALPAMVLLAERSFLQDKPLLLPAVTGLIVAVSGLVFLLGLGQGGPVWLHLVSVPLAMGANRVFTLTLQRRSAVADWLTCALAVLALAQVAPTPWLGLGYIAAGFLSVAGAFPAAALAGLALDLARITPTPMTAVLCLAWLARLIPGRHRWGRYAAPAVVFPVVMALCGVWAPEPLPALALGGFAAALAPGRPSLAGRRGETGFAQVRLELVSAALSQTGLLLQQQEAAPVDAQALVRQAAAQACGNCPRRKNCRGKPELLSARLLETAPENEGQLLRCCPRPGRLLQELRSARQQLCSIRADRQRQREYRAALAQQYHFLSEYLQELSDSLAQRQTPPQARFRAEVAACSASREAVNGDRCLWFAGVACRYYVLLCDGMGTGEGAAGEGMAVSEMLKKLLSGGFPAEYALRSINSLCALRGCAGAVTVDLAELQLDTGRVTLYKWGAPASFLLSGEETAKVGTVTPPPGLSVTESRETTERLSLRRGQTLVLLSDGAGGEEAVRRSRPDARACAGVLAQKILAAGRESGQDDATVAVVRLHPLSSATA